MEKLQWLIRNCRHELAIHSGLHRDNGQTAEQYIEEHKSEFADTGEDVIKKMIETDTVIEILYYPFNTVSSGYVCHYDIGKAIDEAIEGIKLGAKDRGIKLLD